MANEPEQSKRMLQSQEIHSQWRSDYLNPDMDRFYDLAFADILKKLQAGAADRILDAGCGFGYHTVRLSRSNALITAVDFSDVALETARKTIGLAGIERQVHLQQADLTQLPFDDDAFNFVVSWGVIMHIPNMEAALGELARVLKPGGVLVLCENNMHSLDVVIRERAIRITKRVLGRPLPEFRQTLRGTETWMQSEDGGLMVRKTNMAYLIQYLTQRGLRNIGRVAGQFTEAYTNMPTQTLKRFVYALNTFYFRRIRFAGPAIGNILYFRKSSNKLPVSGANSVGD